MELIKVEHGMNQKLAEIFGVSLPTVRKALRGKSNSETSRKIREAAKKNGGEIYQKKGKE